MDAPVRKKKRAVASEPPPPKRGPYCPKCQYEYGSDDVDPKTQVQAELAAESEIPITCPSCGVKKIPVKDVKDTQPPPPGPAKRAPIEPGFRSIIENVFQIDPQKTWKRLLDNLTVGEGRTDHGTVVEALDHAEENARQAHQLYVNMKLDYERYCIDQEIIWAGMYDEAHARLQAEKDSKQRTKQITDADVRYKMAELHPDEFKSQELEKKRYELTVKHAENVTERWASKARDLVTILGKMRGGGVA